MNKKVDGRITRKIKLSPNKHLDGNANREIRGKTSLKSKTGKPSPIKARPLNQPDFANDETPFGVEIIQRP